MRVDVSLSLVSTLLLQVSHAVPGVGAQGARRENGQDSRLELTEHIPQHGQPCPVYKLGELARGH